MEAQTMKDVATQPIQGRSIPTLGFGTFQFEGEACYQGVREALEIGYRHLDTAQMYGNEKEVGRALRDAGVARDEVFLTTKIWSADLAPEDARRTTEESLERLGVDAVDLLLIHWPNDDVPLDETLAAMIEMHGEGKTRSIGVSNFPSALLRRALELAPIVCNQVEYHPFLGQDKLLALAREHDLMLTAYSPLARGRVAKDPTLQEIGRRHGKTAVQVALRWLIQQPQVAAIPKAATAEHRRANFEIFDFELSEEEMEQIHGLERGQRVIDPDFGPDWD